DPAGKSSGWEVEVDALLLDDAAVRYKDVTRQLDATAQVSSSGTPDEQGYSSDWSLEGTYRGAQVSGKGQLGQIMRLRDGKQPFPVKGKLDVAGTSLAARGTVTNPRQLAGLDLQLELAGPT